MSTDINEDEKKWFLATTKCLKWNIAHVSRSLSHCDGSQCHLKWERCHATIILWEEFQAEHQCVDSYDVHTGTAVDAEHSWSPPIYLTAWWSPQPQCLQRPNEGGKELKVLLVEESLALRSFDRSLHVYFLLAIYNSDFEQKHYYTKASTKANMPKVMTGVNRSVMANARHQFCSRVEGVVVV